MRIQDPLYTLLREKMNEAPIIKRLDLLKNRSESEFIEARIYDYYDALERAAESGCNLVEAEERALQTLLNGLA